MGLGVCRACAVRAAAAVTVAYYSRFSACRTYTDIYSTLPTYYLHYWPSRKHLHLHGATRIFSAGYTSSASSDCRHLYFPCAFARRRGTWIYQNAPGQLPHRTSRRSRLTRTSRRSDGNYSPSVGTPLLIPARLAPPQTLPSIRRYAAVGSTNISPSHTFGNHRACRLSSPPDSGTERAE